VVLFLVQEAPAAISSSRGSFRSRYVACVRKQTWDTPGRVAKSAMQCPAWILPHGPHLSHQWRFLAPRPVNYGRTGAGSHNSSPDKVDRGCCRHHHFIRFRVPEAPSSIPFEVDGEKKCQSSCRQRWRKPAAWGSVGFSGSIAPHTKLREAGRQDRKPSHQRHIPKVQPRLHGVGSPVPVNPITCFQISGFTLMGSERVPSLSTTGRQVQGRR